MKKIHKSAYFDIILSAAIILIVVGYTLYHNFLEQQMIALYILDNNKKAIDYPHTIIIGVNNSVTFYVGMDNKLWRDTRVTLKIRLSNDTGESSLYVYSRDYFLKKGDSTLDFFEIIIANTTLVDEEFWIKSVYVNGRQSFIDLHIKKDGILFIVVELWQGDVFSGQWVELKIRMIA